MDIKKENIVHVANLAKLYLNDDETFTLTNQMSNIIGYVEKLGELDTENIQPTAHVIPMKNVLREDEVYESFERDKIIKNSPSNEDGCFKVPRIVE